MTRDHSGFALMLVVLMLFAISVAAAAGYQVVTAEFTLAGQNRDGQRALSVAHAGLQRFLAEQFGAVGDSVSYAIGDGVATVTTRKLYEQDPENHLYYVRSEGSIFDDRTPDAPARRVVSTYAWHRIAPIPHRAMIFITDKTLVIENAGTVVSGMDASTSADCVGGGTAGVYAVATGGTVFTNLGGSYSGFPGPEDESYTGWQDVYDNMNIRWDVLSDLNFPVEFEGSPPSWATIPADSFPVLRYDGDLLVDHTSPWSGGHGTLIVTGRIRVRGTFTWDGLIVAGRLDETEVGHAPVVRGMIVAGMNGLQRDPEVIRSGTFQYDYCLAQAGNRSLSYLEPVDGRTFAIN